MKCHICNNELKETDKFCNNCGSRVKLEVENSLEPLNQDSIIKCTKCNAAVEGNEKFCYRCGNPLVDIDKSVVKDEVLQNKTYCHICNTLLQSNEKYCISCGAKVKVQENDIENDIISSRFNYNNNNFKNDNSKSVLWLSLGILLITFVVGGFFPIITAILGFAVLVFIIIKLTKLRNKITVWSLAITILALMMSGLNITNDLISRDYAFESRERISEIIDIELPEVDPSFYEISIIDEEIVRVTFTDFSFNDIIYELNDSQANSFEIYLDSNTNFNVNFVEYLDEEFDVIMLEGIDISLVYDIDNYSFSFPSNLESYNIIVINYDYDQNTIQILEISRSAD